MRIRDTGVGIPRDALTKIFDMFGQADLHGARSRGGLGIGLSLVKRIVEMHGGSVRRAARAPAAAANSWCAFPRSLPSAPPRRHPPASRRLRRRAGACSWSTTTRTPPNRWRRYCRIGGHETRLAHDGLQAVEEAKTFQPDVVFLDIGMPEIDGHETARRIREQPWGKNMVLVALTGWGQDEDRRRSKEAGFNHHLVKPADPAVVAKLISSLPN